MTYPVTLTIWEMSQDCGIWELGLSIRNDAQVTLLLPPPEITSFEITRTDDGRRAEWGTFCLTSGWWRSVLLQPGADQSFTFRIVPLAERHRLSEAERVTGPHVFNPEMEPGVHDILFRLLVDDDYYHSDSHWKLSDIRRAAASKGAEAWTGKATSNQIRIKYA